MSETNGTECNHCCNYGLQELQADMNGSFLEVTARMDSMELQLRNLTGMIRSLGQRKNRGRGKTTKKVRKRKKDVSINSIVPGEIWERIFQCLPVEEYMRMRLVCHRWKQIVDGCPTLMRRAELFFPKSVKLDDRFKPEHLPLVGGVTLRGSDICIVDPWWSSIGPGLIRLDMDSCFTLWLVLARMLQETPKLKRLNLKSEVMDCEEFPEKVQLNHLEDLTVNSSKLITKLSCPRLKRLECWAQGDEVKWFLTAVKDTLEDLTVVLTFEMLKVLVLMQNLTHLNACLQTRLEDFWYFLEKISKCNPKLKRLSISTVSDQTGSGEPLKLSSLRRFTGLEYFKVCGTYPSAGMLDFSDFIHPALKELYLESLYFFEGNLEQGLRQSPNISHLSFTSCKFENTSGIVTALGFLHQSLRYLKLENVSVTFSNCPQLKTFSALKCLHVGYLNEPREFFIHLMRACPNVEMLVLDTIDSVEDEVIATVCQNMNHLKCFAIRECEITDLSVRLIVENCTELKKFAVDRCFKVTGKCLDFIAGLEYYDHMLFKQFR